MNEEALKYYIALQLKFREVMGEWPIKGDPYLTELSLVDFFDAYFDIGEDGEPCERVANAIRLPLPIDPRNPERGLWGMIDWGNFDGIVNRDGSKLIIRVWNGIGWITKFMDRPEIALLKALAWQEGIEVK